MMVQKFSLAYFLKKEKQVCTKSQLTSDKQEKYTGNKTMTNKEFSLFRELIYSNVGINLSDSKKLMLTTRLSKKLKVCNINSFKEYYNFIQTSSNQSREEYNRMVDVITTNKTDFFREPVHFDFLTEEALPELVQSIRFKSNQKLQVWSAGCSSGEEVYTLGIVLSEFFSGKISGDFSILGTDISEEILTNAAKAVYPDISINPINHVLKKKYLMKGTGNMKGRCKIIPELIKKTKFKKLNFMQSDFGFKNKFDIIFCRNVVIYFDKKTQIEFFKKLYNNLTTGGYLFIGSSETLFGINSDLTAVGTTIYRNLSNNANITNRETLK
jgi:chemotaxis protein methyltransferase CheR